MATCKSCGSKYSILTGKGVLKGLCNDCFFGNKYADTGEFQCWSLPPEISLTTNQLNEIHEDKLAESLIVEASGKIEDQKLVIYRYGQCLTKLTMENVSAVKYENIRRRVGFLRYCLRPLSAAMEDGSNVWRNPKEKIALYFYQKGENSLVLGIHPIHWDKTLTILRKIGFSPEKA